MLIDCCRESLASLTQELNPTRDFDILYRAKEVMDEREQTRQDEHDKMQTNLKSQCGFRCSVGGF